LVHGRPGFFNKTAASLERFRRIRQERRLGCAIRLKHVLMEHTLGQSVKVGRFAKTHGYDVCCLLIEQNYNASDDPAWYEHSGAETARTVVMLS
jgi:hypothetical protein